MHSLQHLFKSLLLILPVALVAWAPQSSAVYVDEVDYGYPYMDPYLATTTIAIMKGRDEREARDTILDLQVELLPDRNDIPLLEGKGNLRFRLYKAQGTAPLIVLVPGLGSAAYTGSASYLAELLVRNGFHVMVMPDPLNWNFALAASTSGYPGHHVIDALDMYRAMRAALRHVVNHEHIAVGKLGLMGFSEGALNAAFVAKVDQEQGILNFEQVLLINPPVDPLFAVTKIDELAKLGATLSPAERKHVHAYAFGTGVKALKQEFDDEEYFSNWDKRLKMTDKQIRYLIGAAMFSEVGDMIYTVELFKHPGVLKTPVSWGSRTLRLDEARSIGVLGYMEKFLLPYLKRDNPRLDVKALDDQTSLKAIGPFLAKSHKVLLMHNRDDILLTDGDMAFLERTFGQRATIYPLGGHLGNLWYDRNRQDIVDSFRSLQRSNHEEEEDD
jgi:acetyl esterase/lipase